MGIEIVLPPLIETAIASGLAVLLALLLRRPLRRRFGVRIAYLIWAAVPLAIVAVLLPAPRTETIAAIRPFEADASMIVTGEPATAASRTGGTGSRRVPAPIAEDPGSVDWPTWAAALWLFGTLAAFALLCRQQRRFMRSLGALRVEDKGLLRAQGTAGCPALIGAVRPRIVLPVDFDVRYSATERELVLAHERMHLARGDAVANAIAAGLRCVFWFNPLIHWSVGRFRFDQELACDAAVLQRFPQARRSYAAAMLKTQLADVALPVGCHWQSSHPLWERIAMLKQPLPGAALRRLGLTVVALFVGTGAFAAWAAQPPGPSGSRPGGDAPPTLLGPELPGDMVRVAYEPIGEDKETFSMFARAGSGDYFYTPLGRRFRFVAGRGGHHWQAQALAAETHDGKLELISEVTTGKAQVDKPRVTLSPDRPAHVRIEDRDPATGTIRSGVLLKFQVLPGPSLLGGTVVPTVASSVTTSDGRPVYDIPEQGGLYTDRAGDEGATAVYRVLVGANGRPMLVELEPGSVEGEIAAEVLRNSGESDYNLRFRPAMQSGKAVESWVRRPVRFVGKRQQAREQREHEARKAALRADPVRS